MWLPMGPGETGCFYTGQLPDVPMALCYLGGCRLHQAEVQSTEKARTVVRLQCWFFLLLLLFL